MKINEEDEKYWNKEVALKEDFGAMKKGRKGICTADLKQNDVFAVWFAEPVCFSGDGNPIHWITFKWPIREKFEIISCVREEMTEMWKPITDKMKK